LLLVGLVPAHAQTLQENFWVADSAVRAVVRDEKRFYIGGDFTYIGPNTGSLAVLNLTNGKALANLPRVNGTIRALATDEAGGIIMGGNFTKVDGVARNRLARLLPDFKLDSTWNPGANGEVFALLRMGGRLFVGGAFTEVGGARRNKIAALDARTATPLPWNPDVPIETDTVYCLAAADSAVLVGGNFRVIGSEIRMHLARLDTSTNPAAQRAAAWDPAPAGPVLCLAVKDSVVFIGGRFASVGGVPRRSIAAVGLRSGAVQDWFAQPDAGAVVYALALAGNRLYVGGHFKSMNGTPRSHVACLDVRMGKLLPWAPIAGGTVLALAATAEKIFMSGRFTQTDGAPRAYFAAADAAGKLTAWSPGADGPAFALLPADGVLWAGGSFSSTGGQSRRYLAVLESSGKPAAVLLDCNAPVHALAISGNTLFAGGAFTTVQAQPRAHIAAVQLPRNYADPKRIRYKLLPWNPGTDGTVTHLLPHGNALYVGGVFTQAGGRVRQYLAAFSKNTRRKWAQPLRFNPAPDRPISDWALRNDILYVGGRFTEMAAEPRNYLAALKLPEGTLQPWNPAPNNVVNALALGKDGLYIGGRFDHVGQTPQRVMRAQLAAVHYDTGAPLPWNAGSTGEIYALGLNGRTLYAGGSFAFIGSRLRRNFASLDVYDALATPWTPQLDRPVQNLTLVGKQLFLGGSFGTVMGEPRRGLAAFKLP
jgi:hypothetical protein